VLTTLHSSREVCFRQGKQAKRINYAPSRRERERGKKERRLRKKGSKVLRGKREYAETRRRERAFSPLPQREKVQGTKKGRADGSEG